MKTSRIIMVPNLSSIPQCWLYQNKTYFYMEQGEIGDPLPFISIKHKHILEDNGIPFRPISDDTLEYWSPNCYEEIELSFPLYIPYDGGFRLIKNYSGPVITGETQDKAFIIERDIVIPILEDMERKQQQKINQEQKILEEERKQNLLVLNLLNSLNWRPAVGISERSIIYPSLLSADTEVNLISNGSNLKVIPVFVLKSRMRPYEYLEMMDFLGEPLPSSTDAVFREFAWHYAIFNMAKLPSDGILEILVPKGTKGMFIGRNGWQVKEWCRKLGLRRINITEA